MTASTLTLGLGRLPRVRHAVGPQVLVAGGQALAGAGNLAFALVIARRLAPGDYADVVAFLAAYMLLHLPAAAVSAAGAMAPEASRRIRRWCVVGGLAAAGVLAAAATPLAELADVPRSVVLLLAAAAPGACLLGLERGRLYGLRRHGAVTASLLVEPVVRLGAGAALAAAAGPVGAAGAVVAGGYAALGLAACARGVAPDADVERRRIGPLVAAFLLLAVLQNQDVLVAKALLDGGGAATFALISALGGAAAFATATIPLVLLPDAGRRRHAVTIALVLATAIGGAAVAVAALVPEELLRAAFGTDRSGVAHLLAPYVGAMALLGVTRTVVAARCATGRGVAVTVGIGIVTLGHAAALVLLARSPGQVVLTTLAASAALAGVVAAPAVLRVPALRLRARVRSATWTRTSIALVVLVAVATAVRLAVTRGIWIDEAISIQQARLPFAAMLEQLRGADVHPPLFHALLWCSIRVAGSGTLAVKALSVIAGVAVVPVLYAAGHTLYDRRTGIVAATLGAVSPFLVWYSQEARMYSVFMLLASLAVLGQVRAVRRGRVTDWGLYALATAAMLWTQYFAVLPVVVQLGGFAVAAWVRRRDRREVRRVLLGTTAVVLAVAVLLVPLAPFLADQFDAYASRSGGVGDLPASAGTDASSSASGLSAYAAIANGIWAVWGYHADGVMAQLGALWPLGMLAALLALGRRRSRVTLLLLALVLVPGVVLFAVGTEKRDLFEVRYFSGAVPAILLLGARSITAPTRRWWVNATATTVAAATLVVALVDQQVNGANPRRYDFESALRRIEAVATPNDVLLFEPLYLRSVVDYYAPGLRARPLGAGADLRSARQVYVLATERVTDERTSAAKVGDVLADLEQERRVVDRFRRPNVRVWVLR